MVDPWYHFDFEEYPDMSNEEQEKQDLAFETVFNATRVHGSRAALMRMTSLEASMIILEKSLDFVYIDAQHGQIAQY